MIAAPPTEGDAGRRLRRMGLWLLLLASVLPYHGCRAHPVEFDSPGSVDDNYKRDNTPYLGAVAIEWGVRWCLEGRGLNDDSDMFFGHGMNRDDQGGSVFVLLPLWVAGLIAARRPRLRRPAGLLLCLVSAGMVVAVGSAAGDGHKWIGPAWARVPEAILLALSLIAVLVWRPPGRRSPWDLEATVSSQALGALGFAAFFPFSRYVRWVFEDGHSRGATMLALWENYRIGFWGALAGLSLVAAPLYLSGERLARLYDAPIPWRFRWWTRMPTSTSTGSTPTGTRSSNGPGPPGSSPS